MSGQVILSIGNNGIPEPEKWILFAQGGTTAIKDQVGSNMTALVNSQSLAGGCYIYFNCSLVDLIKPGQAPSTTNGTYTLSGVPISFCLPNMGNDAPLAATINALNNNGIQGAPNYTSVYICAFHTYQNAFTCSLTWLFNNARIVNQNDTYVLTCSSGQVVVEAFNPQGGAPSGVAATYNFTGSLQAVSAS